MAKKKDEATGLIDPARYGVTKIRDKDGVLRHSRGADDAVARAMLIYSAGGGDTMKLAKANGLGPKYKDRDTGNTGLFRMAVGNSLRALVRNGTPVVIGEITVKTLEQNVKVPEDVSVEKPARKAKPKSASKRRVSDEARKRDAA